MLLVISDGGRRAAELSGFLEEIKAPHMFHFPSFDQAGGFGRGSAVVGKLSYKSLRRTIDRCGADMLLDIVAAPRARASLVALNVAEDTGIPLAKLIEPVVPGGRRLFAESAPEQCRLMYSYTEAAAKINNTVGNTVFLAEPLSVRPVADRVFDRSDLYAPIEAGAEFDVDLALEYGIPLLNVREYDGISGRDGILNIMTDCAARLLVTDSSSEIEDKLFAAEKCGAELIFIQNTGYEYKNIFDNFDDLKEFVLP